LFNITFNFTTHLGTNIAFSAELVMYNVCGMLNPVVRSENHVNFYNKYLLLLTEYTDRQAECVVIGETLWALKIAICLRPGAPDGWQGKLVSQQATLC
jgi:hypothetical protein